MTNSSADANAVRRRRCGGRERRGAGVAPHGRRLAPAVARRARRAVELSNLAACSAPASLVERDGPSSPLAGRRHRRTAAPDLSAPRAAREPPAPTRWTQDLVSPSKRADSFEQARRARPGRRTEASAAPRQAYQLSQQRANADEYASHATRRLRRTNLRMRSSRRGARARENVDFGRGAGFCPPLQRRDLLRGCARRVQVSAWRCCALEGGAGARGVADRLCAGRACGRSPTSATRRTSAPRRGVRRHTPRTAAARQVLRPAPCAGCHAAGRQRRGRALCHSHPRGARCFGRYRSNRACTCI